MQLRHLNERAGLPQFEGHPANTRVELTEFGPILKMNRFRETGPNYGYSGPKPFLIDGRRSQTSILIMSFLRSYYFTLTFKSKGPMWKKLSIWDLRYSLCRYMVESDCLLVVKALNDKISPHCRWNRGGYSESSFLDLGWRWLVLFYH